MKHKMNITTLLTTFAEKFGLFIIGGLIGAIIHRLRTSMSLKRFIGTLIISAFIGVVVGILCRNYLNINEEITFVFVSISGVFSQDILNELEQLIKLISVFVKKFFAKKLDIDITDKDLD